jgi:hypothetical protein
MPPAGSLTADQLSFFDTNGKHAAVPSTSPPLSNRRRIESPQF